MLKEICKPALQTLLLETRDPLESTESAERYRIHYWGATPEHNDNPVHRHSFYEICYVLDGTGVYMDDGRLFELNKGVMFCSRPGFWHQIREGRSLFLLYVAFEEETEAASGRRETSGEHASNLKMKPDRTAEKGIPGERSFYAEMGRIREPVAVSMEHSSTAYLWQALLLEAARADYNPAQVRTMAYALLTSFPQVFADRNKAETARTAGSLPNLQLQQAKLFILDNLGNSLKLDEVAAYLHMSGRHLSRLFSEGTGQSFTEFVMKERVKAAEGMLKTAKQSVKQVAAAAGFDTVHYFTRVFTAETGIPPARYRRQHMEGEAAAGIKKTAP